jgi:hypothetical protein
MLLLVGILLGIAASCWFVYGDRDVFFHDGAVGCTFAGLSLVFGIIVGGLFGFIAAEAVGQVAPGACVHQVNMPLVDLFDTTGPQGHFYLGSGYINNKLTYFYYTKESDGHYQINDVEGSLGRIYEDSPAQPYVNTATYEVKPGIWDFLAGGATGDHTCTTDFHVPANSVQQGYHVG